VLSWVTLLVCSDSLRFSYVAKIHSYKTMWLSLIATLPSGT
jgi:hypothetical protein